MRFESGKTSTRKTENLAHLTYPHAECGISVFLVSVENGAGVNKMTNITYCIVVASHQMLYSDTEASARVDVFAVA